MAKLEIEIHCLCFFVPDPIKKTVHVLMPATHHHGHGVRNGDEQGGDDHHGHTGGVPHHVVHVLHPTFGGPTHKGRPMGGFALVLGKDPANADAETKLRPRQTPAHGDEIVDLTTVVPGELELALVDDLSDQRVGARLILRSGYVNSVDADAKWRLDGRKIAMGYKVVWVIDDITEDQVIWKPLNGGGGTPPFRSLADLGEDDGVYRFQVAHMTYDALPPKGEGSLNPADIKEHFKAFYTLYGIDPKPHQLPDDPELLPVPAGHSRNDPLSPDFTDNVNCPTAQGTLKPRP